MNDDYNQTAQLGGARRRNGHKSDCSCHICENMKNKDKRGGYEEDLEKEQIKLMGGSKKKNGHKPNCDCPICKNMKNAKKGGKQNGSKKSNGHKTTCKCPICNNMKKNAKKGGDNENQLDEFPVKNKNVDVKPNEILAADDEYDKLEAGITGGTRKKRNSNGHKITCNCPICKNIKKNKKTRRHKKRSR